MCINSVPCGVLLGSYADTLHVLLGSYADTLHVLLGTYADTLHVYGVATVSTID